MDWRTAKVKKYGLVALLGMMAIGGSLWAYAQFKPHPEFRTGLNYLEAGSFDAAIDSFRLCLADQPKNSKAKGLLAYSALRRSLERDSYVDDHEQVLLDGFTSYYTMLVLDLELDSILDKDGRDRLRAEIREFKESALDSFREHRIPFRDWEDIRNSFAATVPILYEMDVHPDDTVGIRVKAIAAAVLANNGDRGAAKHLIEQAVIDPQLLTLTAIAGDSLESLVEEEIKNPDSFIGSEGRAVLQYLRLKEPLMAFGKEGQRWRLPTITDIPAKHRPMFSEHNFAYTATLDSYLMLKSQVFKDSVIDPTSIDIMLISTEGQESILILRGFSATKRRFLAQAYFWDGNVYKPVAFRAGPEDTFEKYTLEDELPVASRSRFLEEGAIIELGTPRIQEVTVRRSEPATRKVTRHRTIERYNPRLYTDSWGYYRGGYETVREPYQVDEEYTRTFEEKVDASGVLWKAYKLDPANLRMTFDKMRWVRDGTSQEIRYDQGEQSPEQFDSGGSLSEDLTVRSDSSADEIDRLSARAKSSELSTNELSGLTMAQLRLLRNALYARNGYRFSDEGLYSFFNEKSWYSPDTSNTNVALSRFSEAERRSLDKIVGLERG